MLYFWKLLTRLSIGLAAIFIVFSSQAGLFDDEEARKAILELRQRVDTNRLAAEAAAQRADVAAQRIDSAVLKQNDEIKDLKEGNATLRRSLLDLQNQIEAVRAEQAKSRGQDEQLARDLAEVQRRQKDIVQGVEDRMRKFEPAKVSVDGREFTVDPAEKRDYDAAFAIFRKPDFPAAQNALTEFVRRYPQSGYSPSALFWLGNAQYANRDYQGAIFNFRNLISLAPDHPKSSEAALSIANCQVELKDTKAARKTLEDLIKVYPKSEAAVAAAERLTRMK